MAVWLFFLTLWIQNELTANPTLPHNAAIDSVPKLSFKWIKSYPIHEHFFFHSILVFWFSFRGSHICFHLAFVFHYFDFSWQSTHSNFVHQFHSLVQNRLIWCCRFSLIWWRLLFVEAEVEDLAFVASSLTGSSYLLCSLSSSSPRFRFSSLTIPLRHMMVL